MGLGCAASQRVTQASELGAGLQQPAGDTSLVAAYEEILRVAWDSVLTPRFAKGKSTPVVVWDSLRDTSTTTGAWAVYEALPQATAQKLIASGLASKACASPDPRKCGVSTPSAVVILFALERQADGAVVTGFEEHIIDACATCGVHWTEWEVVLRPSSNGWILRSARMTLHD